MADEWTFVPLRKSSNKQLRRQNTSRKKGDSYGGSGLYGANQQQHHRVDCQTIQNNNNGQEQESAAVREIKHGILECLHALEDQLHACNDGFSRRLISSLSSTSLSSSYTYHDDLQQTKSDVKDANNDNEITLNDDNNSRRALNIREIVAYGIGNFAIGKYQPPMLQLACLLLIRKCAACTDFRKNQSTKQEEAAKNTDNISKTFEYEKTQVPIYYYEPCILPMEKELLEDTFHVHILDSNEMGKLSVESMRRNEQQSQHMKSKDTTIPLSASSTTAAAAAVKVQNQHVQLKATLFYMPHCPMQLYSNVLWAHWGHIFPTTTIQPIEQQTQEDDTPTLTDRTIYGNDSNPILIFGNSFSTYEERTLSSEKRMDPTNGVFRVVPFANEVHVSSSSNNKSRCEIVVDALRHLDMAFNDCNIISFPIDMGHSHDEAAVGQCKNKMWPGRPKEWIASEDPENNGELM